MCTVAVVARGSTGYVLGHNRDESRLRSRADPPGVGVTDGAEYLAPRDPDGGGTWLTVNRSGVTVCVLNAAETDPDRLPDQPVSRGRVPLGLAGAEDLDDVARRLANSIDRLRKTRSFDLVAVRPPSGDEPVALVRIRWDGHRLASHNVEPPALFVSSLLNQREAERARNTSWLRVPGGDEHPSPERLGEWLASHEPEKGPLSPCMHRADARTVSRTVVTVDGNGVTVHYVDGSPCDPRAPRSRHFLSRHARYV